MNKINIVLLEPFFNTSHGQWIHGIKNFSKHKIHILKMSGSHWKWRMHGGAITLAKEFNKLDFVPDLVIASDMVDLPLFISLTKNKSFKTALYFHENQLTYPWSPKDRDLIRGGDAHYKFINYKSALVADKILFNSSFHLKSFIKALPNFLKGFPDHQNLETINEIEDKSEVLYLGTNLSYLDHHKVSPKNKIPIILWNHRWEYDKNPEDFFNTLYKLKDKNIPFHLVVLGESFDVLPECFEEAKVKLSKNILHFGHVQSKEDYAKWLWKADILPVTSIHDYFGISVVEAIYCNCIPLLPNRLAYPEHLHAENHNNYLYENNKQLTDKLETLLKNISNESKNIKSNVSQYDWNNIIPKYDQLFSDIC